MQLISGRQAGRSSPYCTQVQNNHFQEWEILKISPIEFSMSFTFRFPRDFSHEKKQK
jgi:hypothetical protein